jgi:hypothetical protein
MDEFKLNRVVTRIPTPTLTWVDSKTKGLNYKRSRVLKAIINEHKLCEELTGKTVWQVIKDNIELRKEILKLKRYEP